MLFFVGRELVSLAVQSRLRGCDRKRKISPFRLKYLLLLFLLPSYLRLILMVTTLMAHASVNRILKNIE
jgi:hypothetical protein